MNLAFPLITGARSIITPLQLIDERTGLPLNLTGGTLSITLTGRCGAVVMSMPSSVATIEALDAANGQVTLTLGPTALDWAPDYFERCGCKGRVQKFVARALFTDSDGNPRKSRTGLWPIEYDPATYATGASV